MFKIHMPTPVEGWTLSGTARGRWPSLPSQHTLLHPAMEVKSCLYNRGHQPIGSIIYNLSVKNGKCQTLFSQPASTPFQDKLQVPEMPMQVLTAFVPGMEVVISAISSYLSTKKMSEGGAGPLLQKRRPNVGLERLVNGKCTSLTFFPFRFIFVCMSVSPGRMCVCHTSS